MPFAPHVQESQKILLKVTVSLKYMYLKKISTVLRRESIMHLLSMELDLQSIFGLLCTAILMLRPRNSPSPPAFGLIYEDAIGHPR